MKWLSFPLVGGILLCNAPAALASDATLTTTINNLNYVFNIDTEFTSRSGHIERTYPFSNSGELTYKQDIAFRDERWTLGPQYYRGRYSSAVNTAKSINFKGLTYYRINNMEDEVYVSAKQDVWNNDTDVMQSYTFPYTAHNALNASVHLYQTNSGMSNNCDKGEDNAGLRISCVKVNGRISTLNVNMTSVSGRSGNVYIYIPRIPTREIVFNNVLLTASTVSGIGMSTQGWEKARSISESSTQYEQFDFYINGTLRFNNSCRLLNSSGGIAINFQELMPTNFTGKGLKPNNLTPERTEIVFNCDKDIASTFSGMNWSVTATAISDSSEPGILKATASAGNTINNLGVKLTKDVNGTTPVNIKGEENAAIISGTKASAVFYSFPTMMTDDKPSGGGSYVATATVTFNVP